MLPKKYYQMDIWGASYTICYIHCYNIHTKKNTFTKNKGSSIMLLPKFLFVFLIYTDGFIRAATIPYTVLNII